MPNKKINLPNISIDYKDAIKIFDAVETPKIIADIENMQDLYDALVTASRMEAAEVIREAAVKYLTDIQTRLYRDGYIRDDEDLGTILTEMVTDGEDVVPTPTPAPDATTYDCMVERLGLTKATKHSDQNSGHAYRLIGDYGVHLFFYDDEHRTVDGEVIPDVPPIRLRINHVVNGELVDERKIAIYTYEDVDMAITEVEKIIG